MFQLIIFLNEDLPTPNNPARFGKRDDAVNEEDDRTTPNPLRNTEYKLLG